MSGTLALSNDLNVITAEINSYKQVAGQSLFEIGKRLKHVKEHDLAHGQFGSWVESLGFSSKHAYKYIQAFEQFSPTSGNLSPSKIFEMLSLPESVDREQFVNEPQTIPSTGETKTVDEMTVKELREVKQQLKEQTELLESTKTAADHWQKVAKQVQNMPPRVETKTVEVVPKDYEELKRQAVTAQRLNTENVQLQRAINEQREQYEQRLTQEDKRRSVNKDLKKFCQELLQQQGMYTEAILYNLSLNLGDREATQILDAFQIQFSHDVQVFISKIKQMTSARTVG